VIPPGAASRFEAVILKAKATGNTEAYERVMTLFLEAIRQYAPDGPVAVRSPHPMTRVRGPGRGQRRAPGRRLEQAPRRP
jgi:hypothetical protein